MRFRRRNLTWLAIMGGLIGIVLLSGAAATNVAVTLVIIFTLSLAISLTDMQPAALRDKLPRSPLTRLRITPQAREASERARRRSASSLTGLTLLDIGLISTHSTSDGVVMRRSRHVSGDDDGVRPYITLDVGDAEAERNTLVRFEISDQRGNEQFVHEMELYLRDGEMNILADHHLPLAENETLQSSAGEWDLRVFMDGVLLGILGFSLSPSLEQRNRSFRRAARPAMSEPEESPLSLEDLLRGQEDQQQR